MAANIESLFSTRVVPWHGQGTIIADAPTSADALRLAGLDWDVVSNPIYTAEGTEIDGFRCNVRSSDGRVLGVVSDRYQIVQNTDAFSFTDALLGDGVRYETAGSLSSGRRVWMLAKMETAKITGEDFDPYLVFTNTHDGTGAVKVALTPVRVVCQNTLNLALSSASRTWTCIHKGKIEDKMIEARHTLLNAEAYMDHLAVEMEDLKLARIPKDKAVEMIAEIIPIGEKDSDLQKRRKEDGRAELLYRYEEAPDLSGLEWSLYRFVNAVSDYATHREPNKRTKTYGENLFMSVVDGNKMIDMSYALARRQMAIAA